MISLYLVIGYLAIGCFFTYMFSHEHDFLTGFHIRLSFASILVGLLFPITVPYFFLFGSVPDFLLDRPNMNFIRRWRIKRLENKIEKLEVAIKNCRGWCGTPEASLRYERSMYLDKIKVIKEKMRW